MPKNDVTFLAFGQDHRNSEALKALTDQVKTLHEAGVTVVLCVEQSPGVSAKSEYELSRYKAALTKYLDKCYEGLQSDPQGSKPNRRDFDKAVEGSYEVNMINLGIRVSDALTYVGAGDFQKKWSQDPKCGRGAAYEEYAKMMEYAHEKEISVKGLDHPDKDELFEREGPDKTEYLRIEHMAEKAVAQIQAMAKNGGGVIIAVNMGAAHVGNLETMIKGSRRSVPRLRMRPIFANI